MIFKTVDDRIKSLGYEKIREDRFGAEYKKVEPQGYIHVVAILHKESGKHILQSYDKDLFDADSIGNCGVGLTYEELKVFTKKFRKLKRKWKL